MADLEIDKKHRRIGNLTVLVAYGPRLFEIPGSQKKKPKSFDDAWNFNSPKPGGGGQIFERSGISYSNNILDNHLLDDHVVFGEVGTWKVRTHVRKEIVVRKLLSCLVAVHNVSSQK